MRFEKGHKGYWLGKKRPLSFRLKISAIRKRKRNKYVSYDLFFLDDILCRKCKKIKNRSFFFKHISMKGGIYHECKNCVRNYLSRGRTEKIRETERIYHRKWRKKERDKVLKYVEKWRKKNKEKVSAHRKFGNAITSGKLKKKPCEVCGSKKADGHHEDYSKPLEVKWLCRLHHKQAHSKSIIKQ